MLLEITDLPQETVELSGKCYECHQTLATFVVDKHGRLLHANEASLRFLQFDHKAENWRRGLWFANLSAAFRSVAMNWQSRITSGKQTTLSATDTISGDRGSIKIFSFEKMIGFPGYLVSACEYSLPLRGPKLSGHGPVLRFERCMFSVPEQRVAWARSDENGDFLIAPRVVSWDQWLERLLPIDLLGVIAQLKQLIDGDYNEVSIKCRARGAGDSIELHKCRFLASVRDASGKAVVLRASVVISSGTVKSSGSLHLGRHLLKHVQESVIATDLSGTIYFWGKGAEKLYGWTAAETIGQPVMMIIPDFEQRNEHERIQQVISTGSWKGRNRQVRKDGSTFLADSHIAIVKDDEGNPIGMVGIDHDITEWYVQQQKITEMQATLASAQLLSIRGELLAGCCHELCQPVFAIQNIISAITRGLDAPQGSERTRELLSMCSQEVTRAAEISEKLRAYASEPEIKMVLTDPRKLLEDCGTIGRLHAELANISFEVEITDEPCGILCDEVQLRHVVINLLRNAFESLNECDFTAKKVSLSGKLRGSSFVISVCDNGIGITVPVAEKIFDSFFTTKRTGTGIGLPMCRSIVQKHGGSLELVRSAAYDGALFEVCLPLVVNRNASEGEPALAIG